MTGTVAARSVGFFARRWRREVSLGRLLWLDMLLVGSALNVAAAFAGLMALGFKAGLPVALALMHAPLPYNIFLVAAVWRRADRAPPAAAASARAAAALWLLASMLI
ncbi:MAG: hypothetical protein ABTQ31_05520 [Rhizobiaceae bacterium]